MLVGSVSCIGLFIPGFYSLESINWQAQSIGQDIMDLFLVNPVLLICAILAYHGNRTGKLIWAGANLYLVYTFVIYSFDVHFNSLFYLYCLCLGLAFYSLIYFLYTEFQHTDQDNIVSGSITKMTGVYFIITSILFYSLWLSDVITAILYKTIPESLTTAGLPTNPVHVLDLAIVLPALFGTGILLMREHKIGFLLSPILLVFTLLMNITIGGLNIVMKYHQLEANAIVTLVMFALAAFNFVLLLMYVKKQRNDQSIFHAV